MSIYILLLILLSSAAGTVTGFGTATIMVPLMVLMGYEFNQVLFFVGIIHLANGIWRLVSFREGFNLRLIGTFGLFGMIASVLGARMSFIVDQVLLTKIIAVFLMVYAVFLVWHKDFKLEYSNLNAILAGILSGFVAGISSMGGAIRAAFLAAFNLPKVVYLANSALLLVLIDSARVTTYFLEGERVENLVPLEVFAMDKYLALAICILVSILGVKLGAFIVDKVPQDKFRIGVAIFLFAMAVKLLVPVDF